MLIDLHQLLYGVTLFTFRGDPNSDDDSYRYVEVYSDGRPVVSRIQLHLADPADQPIPAEAYRGEIGAEVPFGSLVYVWRPGEADLPMIGEPAPEATKLEASRWVPKAAADLRARGEIAWLRDDNGHIVKRPGPSGRPCVVSAITGVGRVDCERRQSDAVNACIQMVRNKGAAIFPDLQRECGELGMETRGVETVGPAERPHVVWWGGVSTEFLDVIDAMLEQEPRIRLRRTSVDVYREQGHILRWKNAEMPVVEGDIAAHGYESQHWLPVKFVWDESRPSTARP